MKIKKTLCKSVYNNRFTILAVCGAVLCSTASYIAGQERVYKMIASVVEAGK